MPIRRKTALASPEPEEPKKALMGSAARMPSPEAEFPLFRFTDEAWQREAWQFYETNGELSYTADYIGSAMSLIRLTINDVDERGVMLGETKDPDMAALGDTMLGGPAKRAQVLRALSVCLTVAGTGYLIGRPGPDKTQDWTVVASQFVRPLNDDETEVDFGLGHWETLNNKRNIIVRVWRQSPQRPLLATSPARALLLTFAQLQKLRMFMSSELNSRIATGGGLYPLPDDLSFPGDADNGIPEGAPGVAQLVWEAASSNIEGYGTAAAIAPIFFEVPRDTIPMLLDKPIRFDAPLSDHAMDYRKELIQDVARGMNVPSDVVEGMSNTNHWQAWWATEEFSTKTVAPDATLIVNALTKVIITAEAKARGKDPKRFMTWFDLAPLNNTADKFADTLSLFREHAVNLETLLASANYNMSNAPDQKEYTIRKMWTVVERDPTLLQVEGVRKLLGLDIPDLTPQLTEGNLDEPGAPPPPAPARGPEPREVGSKPTPELNDDLSASLIQHPSVVLVSNAVVLAALSIAGKKLLTPAFRGRFPDTEPHMLHTKIKVGSLDDADELLSSAFRSAPQSLVTLDPAGTLLPQLHEYARGLLAAGLPHSLELLSAFLAGKR